MSKVLFCGHSRDPDSGWAIASREYQLAMDSVGVDVVSRPLLVGNNRQPVERLKQLESKSPDNCNYIIQCVLPHYMDYCGSFKKNIGIYFTDSNYWNYTSWRHKLNLMDELWVPTTFGIESALSSGVKVPLKYVPVPVDVKKFSRLYELFPLQSPRHDFKFYFIGENIRRKNIIALLHAYYLTFNANDDVSLIIKTWSPGKNAEDSKNEMLEMLKVVQKNMKLYPEKNKDMYGRVEIITEKINEESLYGLHLACDCYVQPSYAEGFCAVPGTLVDTINGPIKIQNITTKDKVFTHTGNVRQVINVLNRKYNDTIINLKIYGYSETLSFTKDHRHYIVKRNNKKRLKNIMINPEFVPCKEIKKGDFFVVPKIKTKFNCIKSIKISDYINVKVDDDGYITCPMSYKTKNKFSLTKISKKLNCCYQTVSDVLNDKLDLTRNTEHQIGRKIKKYIDKNNIKKAENIRIPNEIKLDPDFMFFIGHYIAEGCSGKSSIELSTHIDEVSGREISKRAIYNSFGLECSEYKNNKRCSLVFFNSIIATFLKNICGDGALQKYINNDFKGSNNIKHIIRGIFYGDGCFSKNKYSFSTSSIKLSRDIYEILNINNIFISNKKRMNKINNKLCNPNYILMVSSQHNDRFYELIKPIKYNTEIKHDIVHRKNILEDNNNFYIPIRNVSSSIYCGDVYNISVDIDESYTCNGFATHNCLPALDALGFGKTPITTKTGGMLDFINNENGWLVSGMEEPVLGATNTFDDINTARETWYRPDVYELASSMLEAYKSTEEKRSQKQELGRKMVENFSYDKIGNKIKELLNV